MAKLSTAFTAFILAAMLIAGSFLPAAMAQSLGGYIRRPASGSGQRAAAGVYPEFRSSAGTIHWVSDQMPLKVYVSPGISLDSILDPSLGVPFTRTDNRDHWPDLVSDVISHPEQMQTLSLAEGYTEQQYQAAMAGISSWKAFEKEGLFHFQFSDNPTDADIFVFWTSHFVDKTGMGLFQKDIRGYTAKRSFWYKPILEGKQAQFKPVVILLRTTEDMGSPMPPGKMQASAAHEFGHALGIEGHSTNPNDLMSINYGRGLISPSDAATVRYLYHQTPDLIP